MTWTKRTVEITQIITPDGEVFDLTTNSKKGNWVLEQSGWGMPDIDYISQQGPFQHGVSVRDYRLKPRVLQLTLRQQACDRDEYWQRRTDLINALRVNRDAINLTGVLVTRSQASYESQTGILSLCEFNNELFGGTSGNGKLFKWNGSSQWYMVADQLNAQIQINDMIVYDDGGGVEELYGGTSGGGRLFKWNGVDAWTQVCAQLNSQITIASLALFDDGLGGGEQIFGGTFNGGRLFYYNVGGGAWAQACAQLGTQTGIQSLCVYNDGGGNDLYGGTYPNGMLYRYNPAGPAWVQICAQLNSQTYINDLIVYNGYLYGCTRPTGRLFRYNVGGGAWEQVAPQYGITVSVDKLEIYQGRLYGLGDGRLLRWNNVDAWELMASNYSSESALYSIKSFNNRLFLGSYSGAYLLEYLRRSGDTSVPCFTLRRVLSDGNIRDLCVFIDKGPEFTSSNSRWDEYSISDVIRLWAPDPIIFDPTEKNSPAYTMDPLATGAVNESQTITYTGTWETLPYITITGPINNPIIRNEDSDEIIELDYNIPAGVSVYIDLTPGNQTVIDTIGNNLIGVVTPESNLQSFGLKPNPVVAGGSNEVSIQGTGTTAATDFSFTYYDRYIGI